VVEPEKTMGGEDMSYFLQQSKGCFFLLGVGAEDRAPVHNPKFTFNEDVLPLGVETHCRYAMELLG
jgi:amidohydrolase